MSSPFRLFAALLLPVVALALAGCGFRPLYATSSGVAPILSAVEVEDTGEDRASYLVGVALRDQLGTWQGEDPAYVLQTRASVSRGRTALTVDQVARRIVLSLNVTYALYDRDSGARVTQGSASGIASFDVPAEPYAAIRAEQDATERAARDVAGKVTTSLARYLTQRNTAFNDAS